MMAFITLILTIGLYMLLGFAALIIAFVIALLCALGYHAQKNKVKQTQPSKRVCPMCACLELMDQVVLHLIRDDLYIHFLRLCTLFDRIVFAIVSVTEVAVVVGS